jgi:glycosyltransferase involved in cell wall biosynthesis
VKILLIHNFYRQAGGEDGVVSAERELLLRAGHNVIEFSRHSKDIKLDGPLSGARLAAETIWSPHVYRELRALIACEGPAVAHFHNVVPLISPSAFYACRDAGIPIVRTLHNFQLFCPGGSFYRAEHVCQECLDHSLMRGIRHGCYRQSRAATAAVSGMIALHRWRATWSETVDRYIALSEFSRAKFIEGGLLAEKIVVKPNFVAFDPGPREALGEFAIFAGRLSPEKGVHTLLRAWKHLQSSIPLQILGDGPLRPEVEGITTRSHGSEISFAGGQSRANVFGAMKNARFLVFPSECYENSPLAVVEAFACAAPVIASRMGVMEEIIDDQRTGLHFAPGDAEDLAKKIEWAWTHPREMAEMGRNARAEYEAKYTAERNLSSLVEIYQRVTIDGHTCARPHSISNPRTQVV